MRFATHRDGPSEGPLPHVQLYRNRPESRNRLALVESFLIRGCRIGGAGVAVDRDRHELRTVAVCVDRRPSGVRFAYGGLVSARANGLNDFGKELTDQLQRNDEFAREQATRHIGRTARRRGLPYRGRRGGDGHRGE